MSMSQPALTIEPASAGSTLFVRLLRFDVARWETQRRMGQRAFVWQMTLAGFGCAAVGVLCQWMLLHHVHETWHRLFDVGLPMPLIVTLLAMPVICAAAAPLEWRMRESAFRRELASQGRVPESLTPGA